MEANETRIVRKELYDRRGERKGLKTKDILKELKTLRECCHIVDKHRLSTRIPTKKHTDFVWSMFERYIYELRGYMEEDIILRVEELAMLFDMAVLAVELIKKLENRGLSDEEKTITHYVERG